MGEHIGSPLRGQHGRPDGSSLPYGDDHGLRRVVAGAGEPHRHGPARRGRPGCLPWAITESGDHEDRPYSKNLLAIDRTGVALYNRNINELASPPQFHISPKSKSYSRNPASRSTSACYTENLLSENRVIRSK